MLRFCATPLSTSGVPRLLINNQRSASRHVTACSVSSTMVTSKWKSPRFCIVSDLDHTMVDHHDPSFASLLEFNRTWVSKFSHDSLLVFSTGRSLELYKKLRTEAPMLTPDLLICSVGTEIYNSTESGLVLDEEWLHKLDQGWNREQIVSMVRASFSEFRLQSDSEQRPHKVSYHLHGLERQAAAECVERLRKDLAQAGLSVKVVHSGGIDVDVLPVCASKGLALQFLQARWKAQGTLPTEGIQVNGDSGNDAELYEVPDVYGCVVGNAMQELLDLTAAMKSDRIFRAKERCAAGILETMRHFNKIPQDSELPPAARVCQLLTNLYAFRTQWVTGAAPKDTEVLGQQLAKRLTPDFKMVASDGVVFSKSSYVAGATNDYGSAPAPSEGQGPLRFWLDRVVALDTGRAWFVAFDVWMQLPGQPQTGPTYHTAVVCEDPAAPEGYAIKHIQGTRLAPQ